MKISKAQSDVIRRFVGTDDAAWIKYVLEWPLQVGPFLHPEARCLAWVFLELSFNVHISKMDVQT